VGLGTEVNITLNPEQEHLIEEAIQAGLIKSAGEELDLAVDALRARLKAGASPMDALEWMRKYREWAHSHSTSTPLLSDEAISRESIYSERGL
jgi:hypothetical protein